VKTQRIQITNSVGLHARPAAAFVQVATRFQSMISVRNVTADTDWVDAKSILAVLSIGVGKDHEIELQVDGEDEARAEQALMEVIDREQEA
jgi:phosphocarrier protein HPr